MQSLILNVEEADSSYALARSVSVLDAVNWIGLAVKKIKAQTVKQCFAKSGFGESDVADNSEEASENIAAISNLCEEKNCPLIQRILFGVLSLCYSSTSRKKYTKRRCGG
jgi:hypothetical protein